jgi:hypothetical protein
MKKTFSSTFFLAFFLVITMGLNISLSGSSFTGSGTTFTINIDDASTTVSIAATATGYTFTLSAGGVWTGSATGASASGVTLTIDATGLTTYDTFSITDGAVGAALTFNTSGANTYKDNFSINLDGDGAGGIPGIVTFNGASSFTGSNAISIITTTNIVFNSASSLSTVDGNLTLDANTQLPYTTLDYTGIYLNTATVGASGTGTVNVKGRSGGVSNTKTHGIFIKDASTLSGGTAGPLTVQGWGSVNAGAGAAAAHGIYIMGTATVTAPTITSSGADVYVTGTATASINTSPSLGISVGQVSISTQKGTITSGGNGNVTVTGYGCPKTIDTNVGVGLSGSATIITSGGTGLVKVMGYGGGTSTFRNNYGVSLVYTSRISSGAGGSVEVIGSGGTESTGNTNAGVLVSASSITCGPGNGTVKVTGTGGGKLTSGYNYGVILSGTGGTITSGGSGNVTVTGNGGNLSGTGTGNHGIYCNTPTASITSGGGDISITGTEGGTSSSIALSMGQGSITTATNGGNITLAGNTMNLLATTLSTQAAGSITLLQRTDGVGIDLGLVPDTNGGPMALSSTEFGQIICGGTVNIGNSLTGTLNISASVTNASGIAKLNLSSSSGQGITPVASTTDLNIGTNSLGFGTDSPIKVNITGATLDTQYDQLKVTGNVDLAGAALILTGSYTPVFGDIFTIVSATSVTNTLKDLADGATILFNGVSLAVNYTATTVTLTAQASCSNPTLGGVIAAQQSGSSPFDPVAFTSTSAASGQIGTLEYKWQTSTTSSSTGFADISSSDFATYDPGSLTVTTWFKRLARVGCKSDWTGAAESNVLAITMLATEPSAQATNLYFSNTVSGLNANIVLNYTASASATSYLVVRQIGTAPTFVPVDGTAYSTGSQGSDQIVYVGSSMAPTDNSVTKDLVYYYKVYAFNGSGVTSNYLNTVPLEGNSTCYSNTAGIMPTEPGHPASAGFPSEGVNVTFPNGTSGTSVNATRTNSVPSANFSVLPGVRGVSNLYFTITSTEASPGNYTLILDFSSLGLTESKWGNFKILKRADSSSTWKDITTLGGTIVNRQTDGVWGKFTITGLSSFSDFGGGEGNNTWTVTSLAEIGAETLKDFIASATTLDGDIIIFDIAPGNTITLSSPVVVDKNLTIRGAAGGIILNGNNATRVIEIADTKVVRLENLKIQNGHTTDASGGGIWNNGDLTVINCVISGNQDEGANGVGGILQYSNGLDDTNDVLNLVNCTVTNNNGTAPDNTGTGGLISTGGVVNIYNSIIYGNIGGTNTDVEPATAVHEAWNSCFGNYTDMTIESLDISNISDNPLFEGIVANPTHPYTLLSSSPCIDAGDDSYSFETTDIRGGVYSRKLDKTTGATGTIDIGAYEYNVNTYWSGTTSATWNVDANWNSGKAPTSSDRVVIPSAPTNQPHVTDLPTAPAVCNELTIESGAVVTIDAGKALTISGNLTNSVGTTGLVVKSDAGGTGSLKILGSVSGSATVERNLSIDKWHMISSPLASEPIITFLENNVDIATSDLSTASHYEYAMSGYSTGSWSPFFLHDKSNLDLFGVGKGYRVLTSTPFSKTTYFEGALNSLPINTVSVELGWNLVGNPYTTALNINAGSTGFVSVNSSLLPLSFAAVYFWDAATNAYIAVNDGFTDTNAPVGQGFFVKAGSAGNVTFNSNMQVHDGSNVFKSSSQTLPTITLKANNGVGNASTLIKFMDGAHEGLDVGYDAGIFKADSEFSVYTKLVEDNGVEFQLQYLPTNQYNNLVIPIGIDSKSAGEIVFSVETVQLDPNCKVILEDKLTNTFTDLSKGSYKATIAANTTGTGRFFLHTGDIISGLEDQVLADGKLTAYARGNKEIRVIGEVGDGAVATLFNGLGQVVLTQKLGAGSLNIIGLPNLTTGIYMLNINDKGTPQTIKIMVRK